jgi:peroxiredoxin
VPRKDNLYELPEDLPVPADDGACDHLEGMVLPSVSLMSTDRRKVDLAALRGRTVVYCYPRTGLPDRDPPPGWDEIPGARGCTPQSCGFRDRFEELRGLKAQLFGLSTQDTDYQVELVRRLRLPFEILSDSTLAFAVALRLPTFEIAGMTLIKRLTLVVDEGRIVKVFYPVFPPNQNAREVMSWLSRNGSADKPSTSL